MAVFLRGWLLLACSVCIAASARADTSSCRLIGVGFTPGGIVAGSRVPPGSKPGARQIASPEIAPQIVAWLEKPTGEYITTIYITQQTGRFGLGNRPGRFDFNSGLSWPYGRRITTFPVWSHKNGQAFPQIDYQDMADSDLSHGVGQSSPEHHYCRPLLTSDPLWDAATCSSTVYTDKGFFASPTVQTGYPPRIDVSTLSKSDSPSVAQYRAMNPFDAVSQASARVGEKTEISWPIPSDVGPGDYVLMMEVSLEQDFNDTYSVAANPSPNLSSYGDYGVPYRGQPSVLYRVPFTISATDETVATTDSYVGYGDPSGADGVVRAPDSTITSDTPNTGAGRLLITSDNGQMYRVRVDAHAEQDFTAPSAPGGMLASDASAAGAVQLAFTAPGDDGMIGTVKGYDVRYVFGDTPITDANFATAIEAQFDGTITPAGQRQLIDVKNLLPETTYTFAVRAFDECNNIGPIATTKFTTPEPKPGEVDACFVATAAYGSIMANDVEMLRRFRDIALRRNVLGELAVEAYYTFGPTVAGVVGQSDLLRATARDALAPVVSRVRGLAW